MKYTKSHEWALVQGKVARIGLTKYGVKELGEIVYVELPEVHRMILPGDEVAVLESTKAAVDFSTPLAGKVIRINPHLQENINLINTAPEAEGWLFEVELTHPADVEGLLSEEGYASIITG